MNKTLTCLIIIVITIPLLAQAQTGQHLGEQKFISYEIEYLDPLGVTSANETGITYNPFTCCPTYDSTILPEKYFRNYPLYFSGNTMQFKVILTNDSKRTFSNLKIEVFQEFLNVEGGQGEMLSENNGTVWLVDKLIAGEEIEIQGQFAIPLLGESGIDQTHLRISHWSGNNREEKTKGESSKGQVIVDDFQAGLWCPY